MSDTRLLVGSLSNDLFRVVALTIQGSNEGATRFLQEAKRWAKPLEVSTVPDYIRNIAKDVDDAEIKQISQARVETYLMYGVLLQNYALHSQ